MKLKKTLVDDFKHRQHFYKMAVGQLGLVTAVGAILILEHFQGRVELHTNSVDTEKVVLETVII